MICEMWSMRGEVPVCVFAQRTHTHRFVETCIVTPLCKNLHSPLFNKRPPPGSGNHRVHTHRQPSVSPSVQQGKREAAPLAPLGPWSCDPNAQLRLICDEALTWRQSCRHDQHPTAISLTRSQEVAGLWLTWLRFLMKTALEPKKRHASFKEGHAPGCICHGWCLRRPARHARGSAVDNGHRRRACSHHLQRQGVSGHDTVRDRSDGQSDRQ